MKSIFLREQEVGKVFRRLRGAGLCFRYSFGILGRIFLYRLSYMASTNRGSISLMYVPGLDAPLEGSRGIALRCGFVGMEVRTPVYQRISGYHFAI